MIQISFLIRHQFQLVCLNKNKKSMMDGQFRVSDSQESQTDEGANADESRDFGQDGVQKLEEDSEDVNDDDQEGQQNPEQSGYVGNEPFNSETVDDQYTYEDEEYNHSSIQHKTGSSVTVRNSLKSNAMGMKMGSTHQTGDMMNRSFLTKQTRKTGESIFGDEEGDPESNQALNRLKARLTQREEQRKHVDPKEVVENFKKHQSEKVPLNNKRLDLFFHTNKFLNNFKEQTDLSAVHECYKAMVLKSYPAGNTVFRYGTTGHECFFILKGTVAKLQPEKVVIEVTTEKELIKFYAENFDQVIWEKVEDADEIKEMARLYLHNPLRLDFSVPVIELTDADGKKWSDFQSPNWQDTYQNAAKGVDSLSRPGSSKSLRSTSKRKQTNTNDHFTDKPSNTINQSHSRFLDHHDTGSRSRQLFATHDLGDKSPFSRVHNYNDENLSDKTYSEEVWLFKKMCVLGPGTNFGESALAQSKPFLVTYQCLEDCEIASINREAYSRIVEKAVKRDFLGRIQFLKSFKIFTSMNQTQLENLLNHVHLLNFDRGKVVYKVGDKPDGVYLIQEGAFELTRPGQLKQQADKLVDSLNVDPMAKFQLRKQAGVIKDTSRATVKLAILGSGEMFGLEECSVKPTSTKVKNRSYSVVCQENGAKVIFISHQMFAEKVLCDPIVDRAIKLDCALKEFFHNSRELQFQQTVWNGSLTSLRQIELAAEKSEVGLEERIKREGLGAMAEELKGLPKLRSVDKYFKDRFDTEILNKIVERMQTRTVENISEMEPEVQSIIVKKMQDIEKHFDKNVDVVNADRKQQKDKKARLEEIKESVRIHEENFNNNVISKNAYYQQSSPKTTMSGQFDQSNLQQDSISSINPFFKQSAPPGSINDSGLIDQYKLRVNPHNASDGNSNMKVIHSIVKEKHQLEFDQDALEPNFKLIMSMDQDMSLTGVKRHKILTSDQIFDQNTPEHSYIGVGGQDREKTQVKSQFALNSDILTITAAGNENKSTREMVDQQIDFKLPTTPQINSGRSSNAAEFKGLKDSQVDLTKPAITPISGMYSEKTIVNTLKSPVNRTQNAFKTKENKMLEMFEDNEKNGNLPVPPHASLEIDKPAEGGIIVTNSKQDLKASKKKKFAQPKEQLQAVKQLEDRTPRGQDAPITERSETTPNRSNLGNGSSIRDPKYSQDLLDKVKAQSKGPIKKQLGLSKKFAIPGQKNINIPKVKSEKEKNKIPIYQEGDEINEAIEQTPVNSAVNIKSKPASRQSEKRVVFNESIVIDSPKNDSSKNLLEAETPLTLKNILKPQGPIGSELPFNDFVPTNKSGLKGHKRNQLSYNSKTINEQQKKQKLLMINKESAPALHSGQLEMPNLNNTFTANMPGVYNYSQSNASPQIRNKSMFPSIVPTNINTGTKVQHKSIIQSPQNRFLTNQDLSMIDTAALSIKPPLSRASDIMRAIDTSDQSKREVFVPSQINPRMKRIGGTNKSRIPNSYGQNSLRAASSKSYEKGMSSVRAVKDVSSGHQRVSSFSPEVAADFADQHETNVYAPFQEMAMSSRTQSFDLTGNSYAKQMQQPNYDTQYQNAMMREARQKQLMMEAVRSASQTTSQAQSELDQSFNGQINSFNLSPAAAAAASELIHRFVTNPSEPISTEHFLQVQRKYELPPLEAYQLLLQQIHFQKALLTPPTAATVVKVSHVSYTSHVQQKREEVISFRNDLFKRYTYMRKKSLKPVEKNATTIKVSTSIQTGAKGQNFQTKNQLKSGQNFQAQQNIQAQNAAPQQSN